MLNIIIPVVGIELFASESKSIVDGIRSTVCYIIQLTDRLKIPLLAGHILPPIAMTNVSD